MRVPSLKEACLEVAHEHLLRAEALEREQGRPNPEAEHHRALAQAALALAEGFRF